MRYSVCAGHLGRALLFLAVLLPFAGCGPGGPLTATLRVETRRPPRGAVLFICDGLHADVVERGCREGWLPNIQKRMIDGGVSVEHAFCAMPSITYSNLASFATGVNPASHGIVGNAWFDRYERLYRYYSIMKYYRHVNYDFLMPTIYERLHPVASASVQSPIRRGVTENFANWAVSGVMWFFGNVTAVDKLTATTVDSVAGWANRRGEWPTLLTLYFPGVDTIGHRFGADSERYRSAVQHFDHQLGRVCDWLEREDLLSTTYVVLVTDHGLVPCLPGGRVDLPGYARDVWGRRPTREARQEGTRAQRAEFYDAFDTIIADRGGRLASIHLRGEQGWDNVPTPAAIVAALDAAPAGQRLWELPGIDMIAYRESTTTYVIRTASGMARVEVSPSASSGSLRRAAPASDGPPPTAARTKALALRPASDPYVRYIPQPDDVLGYRRDPALAAFVDAGNHFAREWLWAARDTEFPTLVAQLPALMDGYRTGQLLLFAAPGYSFASQVCGHGGVRRAEVSIPMMFAGPGLTPGTTIPLACAADVVPTLLALVGRPAPETEPFDGVALFDMPPVDP